MVELKGPEKRRYVADLFSRISRRYDLMNTLMTFGMDRRWRKTAARQAMEGLEGPVLDVATGTGDLALALGRVVGVTEVVGMDLLNPMVSRAISKVARAPGPAPVTFMVGDALSLPFPDDSFACVTSAFSLRNLPDLEAALREMVRVTRPGGRVLSLETMPVDKGMSRPLVRFHFRRIVPLLGALITFDRAAYTYLPQSVDRFLSPAGLADLFRAVGLETVQHQSLALGAVHIHWGTKAP
ncbi:MAG: ubiquinone/menaquinone biosynthesis methyltransferase [Chloroflexi bacterium]|nr:ubiquinone/menaquinone biosynthesis methyltransferase [Chloroflexota bacterium]